MDQSYQDDFNLLQYHSFTDEETNRYFQAALHGRGDSAPSLTPVLTCGDSFIPIKQYRSDVCLWLECPKGLASPRQPLGRFPSPPVLTLQDGFCFSTGFELFPYLPQDPFLGQVYCSADEGTTFDDRSPVNLRNNGAATDTDLQPAMRVQSLKMFHPQNDPDLYLSIEWSEFFKEEDYRSFRDKYLSVKVQVVSRSGGDNQLVTLGVMSAPLESGALECDKCCHKVFSASGKLCALSHFISSQITQMQTYLERYSDDARDQHPKYSMLLECKFTFTLSSTPYATLENSVKSVSIQALQDQGRKMLNDQMYTDFTLTCGGKSFPCHKSVLAGHSDALAAMFECKMKEERSQELILEDMSPPGVEALLAFLYYGDTTGPESNPMLAVELLRTGEKYLIPTLKIICKDILNNTDISKVALPDAFAMFELGTMIKDCEILQDIAIKAFVKNSSEYMNETKDLAKLFTANPSVAAFLFCKLGMNFAAFV